MRGVRIEGAHLVIGAATTHAEVAGNAEVLRHIPSLACLAAGIGDPAVRHLGTIGGSIANNDPAADYPSAVLALNGIVVTNKRQIAAEDFFQGMFATALEDGEIITAVKFAPPKRGGYSKFRNPASRYAMVGVYVADTASGVRVAVTGAGENGVFRHGGLEAALKANFAPEAVDGVSVSADGLLSDIHGDAGYRAHLVKVMAKRAVASAA
jgi:carbon-monoxide dehydrogenase medium subunit